MRLRNYDWRFEMALAVLGLIAGLGLAVNGVVRDDIGAGLAGGVLIGIGVAKLVYETVLASVVEEAKRDD